MRTKLQSWNIYTAKESIALNIYKIFDKIRWLHRLLFVGGPISLTFSTQFTTPIITRLNTMLGANM